MMKTEKWKNKKTGNVYSVLPQRVINCSNEQDGQIMIVYKKDGKVFVREQNEFFRKFEKVDESVSK